MIAVRIISGADFSANRGNKIIAPRNKLINFVLLRIVAVAVAAGSPVLAEKYQQNNGADDWN